MNTNRAIIIAAFLISGSILFSGYLNRKPDYPHPSKSTVKAKVTETLEFAFLNAAKKEKVKSIKIDKIQYSVDGARMVVNFSIVREDGETILSAVRLEQDGYFNYRGNWKHQSIEASFYIKPDG